MKKVVSLFLVAVLILGIAPVFDLTDVFDFTSVFATEQTATDYASLWDWQPCGDGVEMIAYKGEQTDVYVPSKIDVDGESVAVIKLGDNLFKDNTSLNSVTLGEGITEIGASAFEGATNMVCIVTSESLTTIGANAFSGCINFNSVVLYDAVTTIGENAFSGCDKLTIYCNENTTAYNYAVDNSIKYEILNPDAEPEVYTQDGITYYIMNGEAIAISFDGSSTKVAIPTTVNNYPVTGLISTFYGYRYLTSVNLPQSLKTIGDEAFYGCSSLTSITIPGGVTSIGDWAFHYCRRLRSITIPDSVTSIGEWAFYESGLTSITIPDSITSIGNGAFCLCEALTDITIPDSITFIGNSAFSGCSNITSITIPDSVTFIGNSAFSGCSNITSITIPDSVTSIGDMAFCFCESLTIVTIPDSVKSIGSSAFENCYSLSSVTIPDSVTSIEYKVFAGCDNLRTVTIPESVTRIRDSAFKDCTGLATVIIPESVKEIYSNSFAKNTIWRVYENSYAHTFAVDNELPYFVIGENTTSEIYKVNGITYLITNGKAIAISFDSSSTDVVIPSTVNNYPVTELRGTFKNNSSLTSIILPQSLKTIGDEAFYDCSNLESITIPDSVTSIGKMAFYGCNNSLTSITIPDSVTSIGKMAFSGCWNLSDITIQNGVNSIGDYAFNGCSGLERITIPNSVTSIGNWAFSACYRLTSVTIQNGVNSIGDYAFNGCSGLERITIPDSVTSIGDYAFYDCTELTTVIIPESVEFISSDSFHEATILCVYQNSPAHTFAVENNLLYFLIGENMTPELYTIDGVSYHIQENEAIALSFDGSSIEVAIPPAVNNYPVTGLIRTFSGYRYLTSVTLPQSLKTIGDESFYGCSRLKSITIPDSVTSIGSSAFSGCDLTSITIPDSVTSIGSSAFYNCFNLTSATIGNGVTSIGSSTFYNCFNLTSATIGNGVTSIGSSAFEYCTGLATVIIPESVISMDVTSFPSSTLLCVYENSYAHTFAVENNLLHFVIRKTDNPEISYGSGITGTATYTDGSVASGATVEILYDDGTVKESVTTDETGAYSFTYAEVGRYTIRVTDASGNTASEVVSVKRMNAFDVYVTGETDLVLKKGYTVSGIVSPTNATITIADTDGKVISAVDTTDGTFAFSNIPNGTYIVKAETESGTAVKEITVFNGDVTGETLTVEVATSATITGYVEVEDREFNRHKRNWVQVTIYNEDGIAVNSQKTDADGNYTFTNLPLGEYSIVAETNEMRPDKDKHFDRSHKLTGYAYVEVTEAKTYDNINIVLYEENDHTATISGKVTAQGESQDCEVILTNVFKHEIAKYETGKNGKYAFKNIPDGLYFITAITNSNGMGFAVVVVHDGNVYGDTDITIRKSDRVHNYEERMRDEIPDCDTREKALEYKDEIAEHKRFYDSLPEKEKKQFSKDYVTRLNKLAELIADISYDKPDGFEIENGGTVVSGDELDSEETIEFVLSVTETAEHEITDGINTREDFEQQSIKDAAKDKSIAKYYDITLSKNGKQISNIQKQTETNGKLRITMEIPQEYRGHKHYSFIHMHNGEPTTLVDLDDDPNTVTFEVDRFSTFALAYSDVELVGEVEETHPASIAYDEGTGKISVSSTQAATLYIATYEGDQLLAIEKYTIPAGTADAAYDFASNQAAFVWDEDMKALCKNFTINN